MGFVRNSETLFTTLEVSAHTKLSLGLIYGALLIQARKVLQYSNGQCYGFLFSGYLMNKAERSFSLLAQAAKPSGTRVVQ